MMFNKKKAISGPSSTGSLILLVVVLVGMVFFIPKLYAAAKLIIPIDWLGDDENAKNGEVVDVTREKEVERISESVFECFFDKNNCKCIKVLFGPITKSEVTNWVESNKKNHDKFDQFKLTWEIRDLEKNKNYLLEIKKDKDCLINVNYKGECVFISEIMDPNAYNCPI